MKTKIVALLVSILVVGMGIAPAFAQQNKPEGLIVEPPPNPKLNVRVWMGSPQYRIGASARVNFRVNHECYVYVLDYDTQGVARLIFPNRYSKNNRVGPGIYSLPDRNYELRVTGPPGTEFVQAIATSKRINIDNYVKDSKQAFPVIPDPKKLSRKFKEKKAKIQFKLHFGEDSGAQFKIVPVVWDADWTSFQVARQFQVNKSPQAEFNASNFRPRVGERVVFDASSSRDPDGRIVFYNWDFDRDGRIDARGRRVATSFSSSGNRRVRLTVKDNDGSTDIESRLVRISPRPKRGRIILPRDFSSNGNRSNNWWKLRRNDYAQWSFSSVQDADRAFLNLKVKSTTLTGGSGYDAKVRIKILNQWGSTEESDVIELNNPFRPEVEGNSKVGQRAYATYRIKDVSLLRNRFKVKIRLVQPKRIVSVKDASDASVVVGYKVS